MKSIKLLAAATLTLGALLIGKPVLAASTPYPMSSGNYSANFSDIVNWPAGLGGSGTTASNWSPVAVNATGTIPDGQKITTSTATFSTSTSGGLQTNSPIGSLTLLATGSTDNSAAVAVDLLLDFTGRNAGALGFDWAEVNNSSGNRGGSVRVYTSTDGSTWTELTAALVYVTNNVAASGTMSALTLPTTFSGSSTARIRFYYHNGGAGGPPTISGSRPKIAIDNVAVTSTGASGSPPVITGITPSSIAANAGDTAAFTVTATGDAANYYWYKETATNTNLISSATTATLTLANVLAANAASYQVVLSNATAKATSSVVTLTVVDPYIVTQPQPATQTRLVGGAVSYAVSVNGTAALAYRWYVKPTADTDFTGMTPLANGGKVSGADTSILTVTNLAYTDATNFFVVITNNSGAVTSSVVTLTIANAAPLAFWNFNGILNTTNPLVTTGAGTAWFTNCTGFSNSTASAIDYGGGSPNSAWGTSSYPTNGNAANNKSAGVQFKVSTLGAKNIAVSFDTRATSAASKYERLQYTTNGTDFIDFPTSFSFIQATLYESRSANLTGFAGVQNNTNFAIRIVTEYESTAKYGATNDAQYVGNGGTYASSSSPTLSYDIVNITGEAITNNNTPPVITAFTNMITTDTDGATVQKLSIIDAESSIGVANVTWSSQNQTVMPDGNISVTAIDGTGTNLTLSITPTSGALGVAPILVTVTDGSGDVTTTWLYVTVNPGNQPPTITGLVNTNSLGNGTNTYAFTVGDAETPAGSLTVSGFSGNTTLVPNDADHIFFGGSGSNRTVSIAPVPGQYGIAPITVTVNDGAKNTALTFVLEVRPNTVTALYEGFDYDTGGSLLSQSASFWANHSGTPVGTMQVGSGTVTVTDGNAEDVNVQLLGQPYSSSSKQVLYSSFTLNYSVGLLPTEGGTYFAHFKDSTTSGFYGRVYASTLNAAPGTYRIGIGNVTVTNTTAQIAQDLTPGVNYTVVTRLVLSNGVSTVWINPTDESSPSVTDTSSVSAPSPITSYAFR